MTRLDLSDLDITHPAIRIDSPGLDCVVVIQRLITSNGAVLHVGGLHMSCLVRGATLDDGFLTIELPVKLESRQRLRQYFSRKSRLSPGPSTVGRDIHMLHFATPRPGKPCNFCIPAPVKRLSTRWACNDGLHFLQRGVLACVPSGIGSM